MDENTGKWGVFFVSLLRQCSVEPLVLKCGIFATLKVMYRPVFQKIAKYHYQKQIQFVLQSFNEISIFKQNIAINCKFWGVLPVV